MINDLLSELSDKGFFKDGIIQYEKKDERTLFDLFDKYYQMMNEGNKNEW